jgi:hypothetical protein
LNQDSKEEKMLMKQEKKQEEVVWLKVLQVQMRLVANMSKVQQEQTNK